MYKLKIHVVVVNSCWSTVYLFQAWQDKGLIPSQTLRVWACSCIWRKGHTGDAGWPPEFWEVPSPPHHCLPPGEQAEVKSHSHHNWHKHHWTGSQPHKCMLYFYYMTKSLTPRPQAHSFICITSCTWHRAFSRHNYSAPHTYSSPELTHTRGIDMEEGRPSSAIFSPLWGHSFYTVIRQRQTRIKTQQTTVTDFIVQQSKQELFGIHVPITFSVNSKFLALCSNHLANVFCRCKEYPII